MMPESIAPAAADTPLQALIAMGGPVMIVLVALAVAGLLTFFYLTLTGALFAPRINGSARRAVKAWQSGLEQQGVSRIPARPGSRLSRLNPIHRMIRDAMVGTTGEADMAMSQGQLRETLAQQAQKALQPFEAPLKIIEVIAALAPLLGLLGTVMGMMEAFSAMATTEGRASASQLSGGIYEALTTTAAGLIIAIPFAAVAAWAEFRLRRLNSGMNELLLNILNTPVPPGTDTTDLGAATTAPRDRQEQTADYPRGRVAHAAG